MVDKWVIVKYSMGSSFMDLVIFVLSKAGLAKLIRHARETTVHSFVGHGDSINEIRTQALKHSLVVSASKVKCHDVAVELVMQMQLKVVVMMKEEQCIGTGFEVKMQLYHAIHRDVYNWFDISFDEFRRPSSPQQIEVCQAIFKKLMENNWLSENTMQQVVHLQVSGPSKPLSELDDPAWRLAFG
ncbi:hypothetical protein C5167_041700 [Papaver somniferum]|nr:hypothetical protein C5167_041700 [Papaver somniferum]